MLEILNNTQKGTILIVIGFVLLLNSMGMFQELFHYIILITALFMILCGFIIGSFWSKIMNKIRSYRNKKI